MWLKFVWRRRAVKMRLVKLTHLFLASFYLNWHFIDCAGCNHADSIGCVIQTWLYWVSQLTERVLSTLTFLWRCLEKKRIFGSSLGIWRSQPQRRFAALLLHSFATFAFSPLCAKIIGELLKLNDDPKVSGVYLHLPPASLTSRVINTLNPEKDVDW